MSDIGGEDNTRNGGLDRLISSSYPITLKFMDISYRVKMEKTKNVKSCIKRMLSNNGEMSEERTILDGITGKVGPGEILAILGPSGSGKSTLLTALAGRLTGNSFTGTILANNKHLSKPVLRRTGLVTQDDILYPHLTVKETLVFCSLLRLPTSLSKKEKIIVAESVITELGLNKCENTIIGNTFLRGISGGERKRVSIGHEMLINPSLLLLDEPTSGLDSTAAHRLVVILESLAQKGKTIVTAMHQPSSRVYQLFHSVLVLSEGRCLYFGKASDAMSYFNSIGFSPSFPMNPADFLLDLANGVYPSEGGQTEADIRNTLATSYNNLLAPVVKETCMGPTTTTSATTATTTDRKRSYQEDNKRSITIKTWLNQCTTLFQRSLKERRHESFNYLKVFQVIGAALLTGLLWWHSNIHNVQDRLGLLFVIAIFWGVFPSFNAAFTFPQERAIFLKERSSGMYTLSSYFIARILGDLPMELLLPTIYLTIAYWMSGLKPELGIFLATLSLILAYVLVAQGLGLALGAIIMDAKQASVVVTVTMLMFVLTGGFYVHKMTGFLSWIKYTSTTFYCYRLLVHIHYDHKAMCENRQSRNEAGCRVLEADMKGELHPLLSIVILFSMFLGYRVVAYVALRHVKAFSSTTRK